MFAKKLKRLATHSIWSCCTWLRPGRKMRTCRNRTVTQHIAKKPNLRLHYKRRPFTNLPEIPTNQYQVKIHLGWTFFTVKLQIAMEELISFHLYHFFQASSTCSSYGLGYILCTLSPTFLHLNTARSNNLLHVPNTLFLLEFSLTLQMHWSM